MVPGSTARSRLAPLQGPLLLAGWQALPHPVGTGAHSTASKASVNSLSMGLRAERLLERLPCGEKAGAVSASADNTVSDKDLWP